MNEKIKLNLNLELTLRIMSENSEFNKYEILNTIKQGKILNFNKEIKESNLKEAIKYFRTQAENYFTNDSKEFLIGITNYCLHYKN